MPGEAPARRFGDFLLSQGIRNEVEPEADSTWSVWIRDEDQIAAAQAQLARFQAEPGAPEFQRATDAAARVRKAEAEDLARYHQRVRTRRSLFPKFGGYGVGVLTYALVFACIAAAAFTGTVIPGQEHNESLLRQLFISNPNGSVAGFLPEVFSGEIWRLFTPMLIHFGPPHLLFNMMWLYQLGCMIEARRGSGLFAALVAISAAGSNVAQYYMSGPGFGGMSGVVYALAGYVWMQGKYNRASGLFLDPQTVTIMLIWLVVCYTGIVGPIANTAHLAGLMVGIVWGRVAAYFGARKPE